MSENITSNGTDTDVYSVEQCGNIGATTFFIVLIMIIAGVGNGLVFGSSCLDPEIRRGGLLPMVTLAITDMLFAELSCLTILIQLLCPQCIPSQTLCTFLGVVELFLVICVMYQHALLAFSRYVAICKAVKYKIWFSTRHVMYALSIIFVGSAVLSIIPSFAPSLNEASMIHRFDSSLLICIFVPTFLNLAYTGSLYFCLPVFVGTFSYFKCLYNLRGNELNSTSGNQQRRLAITMLISYTIVLSNSVPLPIVLLAYDQVPGCSLVKRHICWLILANSCCNPIIYGVKSSKFRRMFLRQLGLSKCVGPRQVGDDGNSVFRNRIGESTINN